MQHGVNDENFGVSGKGGSVKSRHHAWVSSKTTVLPKFIIEEGTVLASGAILTKSTEPYGIYGGVPAKKIAERKSPMNYRIGVENYWHFY